MDTPSTQPADAQPKDAQPTLELSKTAKPPRRSKVAVMRAGVWEPFRLLKLKHKPSALRTEFSDVTVALEELQDEYERVERALAFLREQVGEMEGRLVALSTAKSKAAKDATDLLQRLTTQAA